MNTELIEKSPTEREIKIEIEPEAVREVYNKVSQKYAKAANIPGFRKGFAPLDVVRLRFRDEINNEVLQELLPKKINEAVQEHNQMPLSEPHVHLEDQQNLKLNGSQPVSVSVHFEVMPEIPTPEYKGIDVTRRVRPVEDSHIEDIIEERRQSHAALIPVEDRKSEEGDTVIVDLEGTFADQPEAEPIRAEDLEIPLGDETIEKSFSENLVGVEEDEEKEFTVSYPPDAEATPLAGKTVNWKAKVKSVGKVEVPELNDEWAQTLDDENVNTVNDLRKSLREDMEKFAEADANARLRVEAIGKLIDKYEDFKIPNALIDIQARNLLQNFAQDLANRGVDLNQVGEDFVRAAYEQMRGQAERDVRGAMLLEKIAELENVEVSKEEVDEEIEKLAEYYRVSSEEIRQSLAQQQNGEEGIANNLRTRKAIEAIITHAEIKDGEWIDENAALETQEETQESTIASTEEVETNSAESAEQPAEEKKPKAKKAKSEAKSSE
ncbi:MAG TPA: trigger factor [Pyrinomonadaceae bacterium]|nr:trigger factor [Pyrinomonadaceae bacterium]